MMWGLVLKFVTVKSAGGPHDDAAYVAGWEMGQLHKTLETWEEYEYRATIRSENVIQADLIGMYFGWAMEIMSYDHPYTNVMFKRVKGDFDD